MTNITAADVNNLRKITGAGMMDCKKALMEAEGDVEKAIDILRKKGQKVAANRADRTTSEGCALAAINSENTFGAIVALGCETDFVAKNDGFVQLTQSILDIAIAHRPSDVESLKNLPYENLTVADKLIEQTGVIGEKIDLVGYATLHGTYVASYIHHNKKIAVLVALSAPAPEAAKDIAMQVAAMNPMALDRNSVPQEIIDRELEIGKELARQEGKPENMIEKIAQGRLGKFFAENTLLEQEFMKEGKMTVAQYLETVHKGLTVTGFKRIALG
ncbi:translation elongation factor Ts [Schleiferia thermophila]|uniref:Elongation factor Ts n=1 Tax=Schleiferia thermophila TaxID=884107 RepID=A0A369A6E0_9FLAO|nr:translation elongation factor Ts [Schleiferia thermophila]RCX04920.1 elongation factor Ts [Schleiferia thermophila]GCD79557.1 elongation factor Ts [Schleiferia thermophila]